MIQTTACACIHVCITAKISVSAESIIQDDFWKHSVKYRFSC